MEFFLELAKQDWIMSFGWTLIHSLWQYALIAVMCWSMLLFARVSSANTRYLIVTASLLIGAIANLITFIRYQNFSNEIVMRAESNKVIAAFFIAGDSFNLITLINHNFHILIAIWSIGFLFFAVKTIVDYRYCQHIKNHCTMPTPEKWNNIFLSLAQQVGIKSQPELRISTLTIIPCVIGYIKPVVLIPASILLSMNQQQVEAILLHELAHVRRSDYLIGLLQAIAKTILFFNPFLWWFCQQMDKEREYACDDIAVAINQDPMLFANTLKEFAEMSINQKTTMRITGNNLLLARIVRLFKKDNCSAPLKRNMVSSLAIVFSSLTLALCLNATAENPQDKSISLDIKEIGVQDVLTEVNKKCGTNETLSTRNNDQLTLVLDNIACKDAIKLLQDFAAESTDSNTSNQ